MSRASLLNALAVAAALAASVALAGGPGPATTTAAGAEASGAGLESGELTDATGVTVPSVPYRRIASASTVADRLLLDLCDADRLIAFAAASADAPHGHRVRGRPAIGSIDHVERVAALRPDLLLVHNVAEPRRVERLRDAGLRVFDLGPLRGRATLSDDIRAVAALCGAPERGSRYARRLERRFDALAQGLAPSERRRGLYLSIYGGRLYGGTAGTSYHDVLVAAGLVDAASGAHRGWPQYDVEQLLALDPDVIVTRRGMGSSLCGLPALAGLRACASRDGLVEIRGSLLDAPGPGMLRAAEAVHEAAY